MFVKGKSGNPGGLTNSMRKARGLAREQIAKLFAEANEQGITLEERLWRWWLGHEDPQIRAKGFARARDEYYGSPMMRAELTGPDGSPLVDATAAERQQRIIELLRSTSVGVAPKAIVEEPTDPSVN